MPAAFFGIIPLFGFFLNALKLVAITRQLSAPVARRAFVPERPLIQVDRLVGRRRFSDGYAQIEAWLEVFPNIAIDGRIAVVEKLDVLHFNVQPLLCDIRVSYDRYDWFDPLRLTSRVEIFGEGFADRITCWLSRSYVSDEICELKSDLSACVELKSLHTPIRSRAVNRFDESIIEEDFNAFANRLCFA